MGDPPNGDASFQLMQREQESWGELHTLVDALTPEQAGQPGYFVEGWSAKDVDVDSMNQGFYETMKDVPLETVRVQRGRLGHAWCERGGTARQHLRRDVLDREVGTGALRRASATTAGMGQGVGGRERPPRVATR